jgi:hypothetical protein
MDGILDGVLIRGARVEKEDIQNVLLTAWSYGVKNWEGYFCLLLGV